jgi:hypothetical protein
LGKEDYLRDVPSTQSHGGATGTHTQSPRRLRPDSSKEIAFSEMHRYYRQLLYFSERPWKKRRNMVWGSKLSSTSTNFLLKKPGFKRALITSVINTARFIKNFGLKNSEQRFYVEVLAILLKRISRVKPHFRAKGSWFLLNDNALDPAIIVKRFLMNRHGGYQLPTLVN